MAFSAREIPRVGRENFDACAGEVEGGFGVAMCYRDVQARGVVQKGRLGVCADCKARAGGSFRRYFQQPADVVGVSMGGDDDIEAADAPAPEIGRDDVLAGVQGWEVVFGVP